MGWQVAYSEWGGPGSFPQRDNISAERKRRSGGQLDEGGRSIEQRF